MFLHIMFGQIYPVKIKLENLFSRKFYLAGFVRIHVGFYEIIGIIFFGTYCPRACH